MTAHIRKPHASSRAYLALKGLHAIGGQASTGTWMGMIKWPCDRLPRAADWDVMVQCLLNTGLVYERATIYLITDEGLEHLGIAVDAPPKPAPVIVGPRYVAPMRTLSRKNLPNVRLQREGSFDYRDIPSRHGDVHVGFKSSLAVIGKDAQG